MPTYLIDSHAHLSSDSCYERVGELISRAENAHVKSIVNICTDKTTLERGLRIAGKKDSVKVFTVAATTPHDVEKEGESFFPVVEKCAKEGSLVAIGETGLDYYYAHSPKEVQIAFLKKYLRLANAQNLPVVIHCRDAFSDFFTILDEENKTYKTPIKGVLHCFTGTLAEATELLARGWYISLSGIVTFPKSLELQEVAKQVPLNRLLIETDTPYLAPKSHRGKQNEPAFLVETCQVIADLKNVSFDAVANVTSQNAQDFFRLSFAQTGDI